MTSHALPIEFSHRFKAWQVVDYAEDQPLFEQLVDEGQFPSAMVISCCDSRMQITDMLAEAPGDIFVHRNIANFVPHHDDSADNHGTAAALEYAVTALKVKHIIIVGHSKCGGVAGCQSLCGDRDTALDPKTSFVARWVSLMRPAFEALQGTEKEGDLTALEQQAVKVSLSNLMSFPFIQEAVESGELALHGLWHDIRAGALHHYDDEQGAFIAL